MSMARLTTRAGAAVAMLAAAAFTAAPHAQAQRLSLAERVDRLEQQQAGQGGAVDLVNQINALQSQVQSLQGQVEELKHALDEARQRSRDQYIDLDSRIGRLEGHGAAAAPAAAAAGAAGGSALPDVDLGGASSSSPPPPPRDPRFAPRSGVAPLAADEQTTVPPGDPAQSPALAANDPAAENDEYNQAFSALKDGRYAESARRFQDFIDHYPNGSLTGNAYYWLGESYYVTQNYPIALQTFQTLLQRYPNSQKAPDALLKVGYSQYELKQWDQAEATLNQVVQTYPDTTVARLAQGRLRALQLEARH